MNIVKFNYLYWDSSNYKQFGSCLFSNQNSLPLEIIKSEIKSCLIDGEYFVGENWKVPNLFFDTQIEDDHDWHEFESIELIDDPKISVKTSIEEFLSQISK
jgi:hypothetical protein